MRARNRLAARAGLLLSLGALLPLGVGCSREVKADFPRPPATAAVLPPEERPVPLTTESTPRLDEGDARDPAVQQTVPRPPRTAENPPARRRPAPAPPPEEASETPPPPSTQLARSDSNGSTDPQLVSKLRRAETLLVALDGRVLSREREEQLVAARAFLSQARLALTDGDERRAIVLVEKGLILAEDVERASRR